MAKNISDFEKYAATLSEISNQENQAELKKLYKDNSDIFQFFLPIDEFMQYLLESPTLPDEFSSLTVKEFEDAILPKLKGLKKVIDYYESDNSVISSSYKSKIHQVIGYIKNEMSIGDVFNTVKQLSALFKENEQVIIEEQAQKKRVVDKKTEIADLEKKIKRLIDYEGFFLETYHKDKDNWNSNTIRDWNKNLTDIENCYNKIIDCYDEILNLVPQNIDCLDKKIKAMHLLSKRLEKWGNYRNPGFNPQTVIDIHNNKMYEYNACLNKIDKYKKEYYVLKNACENEGKEAKYNRLLQTAKIIASTEQEYQDIAEQFRKLNYENSKELADECEKQYHVLKEQREEEEKPYKYNGLIQEYEKATTETEFQKLAMKFRNMNGYENSKKIANDCDNQCRIFKERREKDEKDKYNQLVQTKNNASTEKDFLNLAKQFRSMNGYENTVELADECDNQYRELKEKRERWVEQGLCRYCGGKIGGIFTKKCKVCGKLR